MSPTPMIKEESIIVSIHLCADPDRKGYRSYVSATAAFPMKFTAFTQTLNLTHADPPPAPLAATVSAIAPHSDCSGRYMYAEYHPKQNEIQSKEQSLNG